MEATTVNPEVKPLAKSKPTVLPAAFGLAEHKRHDFVVDIHPDVELGNLLEPGFWSHVAVEMQPFDYIEARWEDGTRIAHLRVIFAERTYAKVKLIDVEELGEESAEEPEVSLTHDIKWKGPANKYCVIRKSDNMIVQKGFRDRSLAVNWLAEHERS